MKFKSLLILPLTALITLNLMCSKPKKTDDVPKNIIVFIGDGMGFNHVDATSMFMYGEAGKLVFEGKEWRKLAQATYSAITNKDSDDGYTTGYSPRYARNDTAYLKSNFTDSGAAGTALSTGYKTYNSAIGLDIHGDTLKHASEVAKEIGKSAGVVTSVMLSHATPAGFSANSVHRNRYEQIAKQQILNKKLDVLMGCGHPEYNNDGEPDEANYRYVGGSQLWEQLTADKPVTKFVIDSVEYTVSDINGDSKPDAWTLITDSTDFAALARGEKLPRRLLGIPKVHSTLQQSRKNDAVEIPWKQPMITGLPDLAQMSLAALNVLNQNPKGFFVMIEGGAIDWAAHANQSGRVIEETHDFNKAIAAVVDWIEKHSSWDETLVIVTADHETGMLCGPVEGDQVVTQVKSNGKGNLPEMNWYSKDHTNSLVPLYVRGKGSEIFKLLADEFDPVRGPFVQNTEIAKSVFLFWGR